MNNMVNEITQEPEITSFDARQMLLNLRESSRFSDTALEFCRKEAFFETIYRVTYDSDARHLIRAIAAKGFIPYYAEQYCKTYAQVFGLERQGLAACRIDRGTLSEALISNMLAAADHIYWAFGALCGEVFTLLITDECHSAITLEGVLNLLNTYSHKILNLEGDILADKHVMHNYGMHEWFAKGINFHTEIADRSYRNNPHWIDFHNHFNEQHQRVRCVVEHVGIKTMTTYPALNNLLERLNSYGIET